MSARVRGWLLVSSLILTVLALAAALPAMPALHSPASTRADTVTPSIHIALSAPPAPAATEADENIAEPSPDGAPLAEAPQPDTPRTDPALAAPAPTPGATPEPAPKPDTKTELKPEPKPEPKPKKPATTKPATTKPDAEPDSKPKPELVATSERQPVTALAPAPGAIASTSTEAQPVALKAGKAENTDRYLTSLLQHLMQFQEYPRRARRLGWEGVPVVSFRFDRQGQLLSAELTTPSAHRTLDDAAMAMLKDSTPLPPVPGSMEGNTFSFQLPVRFRLR